MQRLPLMIASLAVFAACAPPDPVYTRCVEEKKAYCNRLFACVALGGVSVQVNFEDENDCNTEETRSCMQVSEENACPGGTSSSYSSAKHDQCIADQKTQSCSAFASRPSSCSSYCCTSSSGTCS